MACKKDSKSFAEGAEGLHVLALGDWGGQSKPPYVTDQQSRVASQMSLVAGKKPLDFIVSLGDNFYMGGVTNGEDTRFQVRHLGDNFYMGGVTNGEDTRFQVRRLGDNFYMGGVANGEDTRFQVRRLGDNFYMGGVTNGEDTRFQQTFEQVYPRNTLGVTWYIIAGNHDHEGNVDAQMEYSRRSPRWHFPALYYTSSHAVPGTSLTLKLIHIDTIVLCGLHQTDPADAEAADRHWTWIERQLAETEFDAYVVVIGHYPVVSAGYHGDTNILVDRLDPLLRAHRVNAYLSGHDHSLQHHTSLGSPWTVHYCVSGTGASNSFEKFQTRYLSLFSTQYHSNLPGFLDISVTGARMTVRYVSDEGAVLHTVKLSPRRHRRTSNGET